MPATFGRAACSIVGLALCAVAQDAPVIFSNYGLIRNWPSEGYAGTAFTSELTSKRVLPRIIPDDAPSSLPDSGCDDQTAPQTSNGSVVGIAVRINLPAIAVYHTWARGSGVLLSLTRKNAHTPRLPPQHNSAASGQSPRSPCRSSARRFLLSRASRTTGSSSSVTAEPRLPGECVALDTGRPRDATGSSPRSTLASPVQIPLDACPALCIQSRHGEQQPVGSAGGEGAAPRGPPPTLLTLALL